VSEGVKKSTAEAGETACPTVDSKQPASVAQAVPPQRRLLFGVE
jgi:hypothetical protein